MEMNFGGANNGKMTLRMDMSSDAGSSAFEIDARLKPEEQVKLLNDFIEKTEQRIRSGVKLSPEEQDAYDFAIDKREESLNQLRSKKQV